jgi:alpha-D-xyloside xylohydrolase
MGCSGSGDSEPPAEPVRSWAFGLWQSQERYATQQESLDVVAGYRSRGIPLDVIVQDWRYWTIDAWGSHQFLTPRASRTPTPGLARCSTRMTRAS